MYVCVSILQYTVEAICTYVLVYYSILWYHYASMLFISCIPVQRDSEDHHRERERRKRHKERHSHPSEGRLEPAHKATPTSPGGVTTKVFYYLLQDKAETPYVTIVPRQ